MCRSVRGVSQDRIWPCYIEEGIESTSENHNVSRSRYIDTPCHRAIARERRIRIAAVDAKGCRWSRQRLVIRLGAIISTAELFLKWTHSFGLCEANPMVLGAYKVVLVEGMMLS